MDESNDIPLPALLSHARTSGLQVLPVKVGHQLRMPPQDAQVQPTVLQPVPQLVGSSRLELRTLILSAGLDDFELPTARAMLEQVGAPYQIVDTNSETLTETMLVNQGGSGRFQAVVLTNSLLLSEMGQPTFSGAEWNLLWEYQRQFAVRSVSLFTNPQGAPDDFGLLYKSEQGYENRSYLAFVTPEGANNLGLKPGARLQLRGSYVYQTELKPGCGAQALLQDEAGYVLAVLANSDGLERMGLTFATHPDTVYTQAVLTGLLRWMTRGVFVGEHRKFIHVDPGRAQAVTVTTPPPSLPWPAITPRGLKVKSIPLVLNA